MKRTVSGTTRGQRELPADSHKVARVDVWCLPLVQPAADAGRLDALLSDEERARLDRIASPERRDRTRIAWGSCRLLLARALGHDPSDVVIVRRDGRAPSLDAHVHSLHFGLSHSGDALLLAISQRLPVGVDIEQINETTAVIRVARRFFAAEESAALTRLPPAEARASFFQLWTMKEAALKATGGGVPSRLRTVPAAVERADGRRLLHLAGVDWRLHPIDAPEGYVASLAVGGDAVVNLRMTLEGDSASAI